MAKLLKTPPAEFKNHEQWESLGWKQHLEAEEQALQDIKDRGGKLWRYPVADGYAHYEVVKENPLTLKYIPYLDCWEAPSFAIRGLRLEDVKGQWRWASMFDRFTDRKVQI